MLFFMILYGPFKKRVCMFGMSDFCLEWSIFHFMCKCNVCVVNLCSVVISLISSGRSKEEITERGRSSDNFVWYF